MTAYIVFAKFDENGDNDFLWQYLTQVKAKSSRLAIKDVAGQTATQDLSKPTEFVAVPARSWQPVKVQVETALKFS